VAVRCVRRNPKLRYRSCVELVADLKEVLAQRSKENEAAGLPDPARGMAYLNRERERLGATQYVRTLETVEYFRSVGRGGIQSAVKEEARRFPFDPEPVDDDGMAEIEELESVESEDDDTWDTVRIAAESMKAVGAVRVPIAAPAVGAATRPRLEAESVKDKGWTDGAARRDDAEQPGGVPQQSVSAAEKVGGDDGAGAAMDARPEAPSFTAGRRRMRRGAASAPQAGVSKSAGPEVAAPVIRWRSERVRLEAAAARLLAGFDAAKSGRGSFGFLERPADARTLAVLRRALALMAEEGVLVDAGSCAAGVEAVCARIVVVLRAVVESRPRRERRKLSARSGAFEAALPLPSSQELAGADEAGRSRIEMAARALAGFGSRTRPLVLVAGDAERAAQPLHELFLALAVEARRTAFYGIAFHGDAQAPDWHTLAQSRGRSGDSA
ncbi:MAG TPA: hypothetical protein PKW82_03995, partial [Spirochaetales bacterium]|nr:hypothetical protein [Spirochaetales bacterium]